MTESKPKPEEPLEGLRAAADAAGQALVAEAERARSGEGNGGGEGRAAAAAVAAVAEAAAAVGDSSGGGGGGVDGGGGSGRGGAACDEGAQAAARGRRRAELPRVQTAVRAKVFRSSIRLVTKLTTVTIPGTRAPRLCASRDPRRCGPKCSAAAGGGAGGKRPRLQHDPNCSARSRPETALAQASPPPIQRERVQTCKAPLRYGRPRGPGAVDPATWV